MYSHHQHTRNPHHTTNPHATHTTPPTHTQPTPHHQPTRNPHNPPTHTHTLPLLPRPPSTPTHTTHQPDQLTPTHANRTLTHKHPTNQPPPLPPSSLSFRFYLWLQHLCFLFSPPWEVLNLGLLGCVCWKQIWVRHSFAKFRDRGGSKRDVQQRCTAVLCGTILFF